MTAKEYLSQVIKTNEKIGEAQAWLEELEVLAYTVRANDTSKPPSGDTSGGSAGFEHTIDKIVDQQAKVNSLIDYYVDLKAEVCERINSIASPMSDVLYARYIDGASLKAIAAELHYSYVYTCRLHGWGLEEISRRYLKDVNQC